jgi:hypothetical protein
MTEMRQEQQIARLREALKNLVNFSWTAVEANCKEAMDNLNSKIAKARAALASSPTTERTGVEMLSDRVRTGLVFRAPYPFIRAKYEGMDAGEFFERETWRPGTEFRGDTECIAEGTGEIVLTVVSVHKPGRYPTRVFFTRKWRDPDGLEFGKPTCRCVTLEKFRRLARGYKFEFVVVTRSKITEARAALAMSILDPCPFWRRDDP